MNFRQYKKALFHKRMPHGYWKKYKQNLRQFYATYQFNSTGSKYPKRTRIRQLKKCYENNDLTQKG